MDPVIADEPPTIIVAGFEHRILRPRTVQILEKAARRLGDGTRSWILARAAAFLEVDGRRRPAYTYPRIAKNVSKALGVKVNGRQAREVVRRGDPALYALRREANRPLIRNHPLTRERVESHWILEAFDLVRGGMPEVTALAKFGFAPIKAGRRRR